MRYLVYVLTAIMIWGCMTFRYVGNGFSLAVIAFCLLAGGMLYQKKRTLFPVQRNLWRAIISLYGTLFIVSLLQCDNIKNITDSAYGSVTLFLITLPMWMVLYIGHWYDIRKIVLCVVYGNMYAFSIYGLWKYVVDKQGRLISFYGSSTEVGMLLDLFIPFTVALGMYYWKNKYLRIASILLVILEMIAVVLTGTRGSYLALGVGVVATGAVYVWIHRGILSILQKGLIGMMMVLCCLGVSGYICYMSAVNHRGMEGGERLMMWESSYHMWEDHKLLGIGLSEWKEAYNNPQSPYRPTAGKETSNVMPHNIYIYFGATGGILSLVGLIGYIIFMCKYLVEQIKGYSCNPIAWAMIFMFTAFMAHGLVDGTLISKHIGRIFYLFLGTGILFIQKYGIFGR